MAAAATSTPVGAPSPWLYGRAVDVLCGYGLLYILSLIPLGLYASRHGVSDWPAGVGALIAMALSTPHYGATLLRVYESRQDRRKYAFFTVWVTAFMLLAFGTAVFDPVVGSVLLSLYVLWSPWHFAGQNFGLAMMSLRRREIAVDPLSRRLLRASFVLSYLVALVAINSSGFAFAQGVGNGAVFTIYHFGLVPGKAIPLLLTVGGSYLVVASVALLRIGRSAGLAALVPTLLLIATHALWFVLPSLSMTTRAFGLPPLVFTAVWISAAHSLQYLWVTSHYARRSESPTSMGPFVAKSLLVGSAVVILPPLLFSPGLVGANAPLTPVAVGVLTFSVVNLHHFILDGAIWKLRDGRVARALLDLAAGDSPPEAPRRGVGFVRPVVYALGVVGFAFPLYLFTDAVWSANSGSSPGIAAAVERYAWLGRDSGYLYSALAQQREIEGDPEGAIEAYRRAVALEPRRLLEVQRLTALLIDPGRGEAGRLEAVEVAERASRATGYSDPRALFTLGFASQSAGRLDTAREAYERSLALARNSGDSALAIESDARLRALDRID